MSMESWDFLTGLGVDLPALQVPIINRLQLSAANGKLLERRLQPGGFGISRYTLDGILAKLAIKEGVTVLEQAKVNEVHFDGQVFQVHHSGTETRAKVVVGCFGKRSNLDIRMKRPFVEATKNRLNNYIGIKYHVRTDFPVDTIALHNFPGGYCGIVKIENGLCNICYLATAGDLQKAGGQIRLLEEKIVFQNPLLKEVMSQSEMVFREPLTISQISFDKKSQVEDHMLMSGDAAGLITPLCGNGMSMALHAGKIAATVIDSFLREKISRLEMEQQYTREWNRNFAGRLRMGRRLQWLFNSSRLSGAAISLLRPFPALADWIIGQTHGRRF